MDLLRSQSTKIKSIIPKHITSDRLLKVMLNAVSKNPKLMKCTQESLVMSIVTCASLGLEPNTITGEAYLIPYENRKRGITEAQFIVGYKGLLKLAMRSGDIKSIYAHCVYSNELFDLTYGLSESLSHKPLPPAERGEFKGAYAVAIKDSGIAFRFMFADEIFKVRDNHSISYKSDKSSIWSLHFEEMAKKTVVRALADYLPLTAELQQGVSIDTAHIEIENKDGKDGVVEVDFSDVLTDETEYSATTFSLKPKSEESTIFNVEDAVIDIISAIDGATTAEDVSKIMGEVDNGRIQGVHMQNICAHRDKKLRSLKAEDKPRPDSTPANWNVANK